MNISLDRVQITDLHGNKQVDVRVKDNTLILVGENGSGKTTILRILFHFLSGRWLPLVQFRFDKIIVTINGVEHKVNRSELAKSFNKADHRLRALPPPVRHRIKELIEAGQLDRARIELQKASDRYRIPFQLSIHQIDLFEEMSEGPDKRLREDIQKLRDAIPVQILYLPTYRRIERELDSIFEGVDLDDFRRQKGRSRARGTEDGFVELVEFGMNDVQDAVNSTLGNLKEFARENLNNLTLRYLGDVVNKEYQNVGMKDIADVSEETVRSVLDRIDESILTKDHKDHLFGVINSARSDDSPNDHSKIISHYFLKLLRFQESLQEKELPISAFCELCSEYTVDKRFVYDSANFSFSIVSKDDKKMVEPIKLSDLSSGEKQIVSLFSHLYLSGRGFFVVIDEPELSLSVPWQRRFLPDIHKGSFCIGLVAATHSPFIYENDLHCYAHSLGEFVDNKFSE